MMRQLTHICLATLVGLTTTQVLAETTAPLGEQVPVIEAVRSLDAPAVDGLLKKGANPNATDALSRTALHYAAALGQAKIMALLLESNAKINEQDEEGFTPLMRAAQNGHLDAAELLLGAGAVKDLTNARGETAIALARQNRHTTLTELLSASK